MERYAAKTTLYQAFALLIMICAASVALVPESKLQFDLASRVEAQLKDPRLGGLAGKLDIHSLNKLANNPEAQFLYDAGTGHINVIQKVEDKLLRITVPRDTFRIISVGPMQERNLVNSIANGRFIPIGSQLEEVTRLDTYLMRVQP